MFTLPLDILFLFTITTPFVGWAAAKLRVRNLSGIYALIGLALSGGALYNLSVQALSNPVLVPLHAGIFESYLRIDALSVFMASIFLSLSFIVTVYSIKFMEHDNGLPLYYTLLLAMLSGMVGVVFSGDFFTLFIFWELMCIPSYVLVAFRKQNWAPVEAGLKYLVMSAAGSATILFGLSLLYGLTGTLNFTQLSSVASGGNLNPWSYVTLTFILAGFGVKAAIFPLHMWLPDAYQAAPSPISALLSGVVIKVAIYVIIRSLFAIFLPTQFSWQTILAIFAILTMTFGNLAALLQDDIKRLLAYSSMAQIGYIFFAISTAPVTLNYGLTAALMHVLNHAIMKGLLFLCAGAFIYKAGTSSLTELRGIGHKMPATAVAFVIAVLAVSGIPPLNGFVSEFMIISAGVNANMIAFTIIMLINILLGFAYYLRLIKIIVWSTPNEKISKVNRAPILMLIPMLLLALACIIIGIYPSPFINMANKAALSVVNLIS
jgi:proton-translocating NADH-quinone oxidoreductase chain N